MASDPSSADVPLVRKSTCVEETLRVVVNGEPLTVSAGSSVLDLLGQLGISGRPLAVELNRDVIPRGELKAHRLHDGDELEIVTLVGGG